MGSITNMLQPYTTPAVSWAVVKDLYFTLVTTIVPGPMSLGYFTPFILLPAALLIPPKYLSQRQAIAFFLVPIYASILHAWTVMRGVDVISVDGLLWSTYFIAIKDPRLSFRRLWRPGEAPWLSFRKSGKGNFIEEPYPEDFYRRLTWVGTLLASTRLHRWKIGEPSHDARQEAWQDVESRWAFVRILLPRILFNLTIYPLLIQVAMHDPGIQSLEPNGVKEPKLVATIRHLVPQAFLTPFLCGVYAYSIIGSGFQVPAPLIVFSNYIFNLPPITWSPHMLPPYFGSFSGVMDYGVTGVWGKWWHQHMRVMVSAPGKWLADGLHLDPKKPLQNFLRYCITVTSGFLFSGITHMGLVPPLAPDAMQLRLQIAIFFWIQTLPIMFEAAVIYLWYSLGLERFSSSSSGVPSVILRMVRLTWAVGWMCFSMQLLILPFDVLGWWTFWWLWPLPGVGHLFTAYTSGAWIP